ncbi:hypothetical protein [Helicobacter sp. MIT 99-5507]|uniref:hypothetical protein n=1 Tax=Helicobacter sp. MIT 99-5507 TaxID=152489 RepID=UPI000E1ED381|nr:hypothetical protein [Helicobacter sp. MIT 99-5507]RDU57310.1 hypothetical protein CQA42_05005 [Helicobacter sp. MIT 99-5507]
MRFIFSLFFVSICLYGLDFDFEVENIYHLNQNDFSVENGILNIKHINNRDYNQSNKSITTKDSKVVVGKNLKFYYHTNRFIDFKEELIELENIDEYYRANVGDKVFKDCFIIIKFIESKKMNTKSNAILLDISSLDSNASKRAYFACLKSNNYIY